MALALGFCSMVSLFQVIELLARVTAHGTLLYPWLLKVQSLAQPGSCGGAWKPTLLILTPGPRGTLKD